MPFCGFVSFTTSTEAELPEGALRAWVSRNAMSRQDEEWTSTTSRGWMCAYSLVTNPGHRSTVRRVPGGICVGDVPHTWSALPGTWERLARQTNTVGRDELLALLPETEFALAVWAETLSHLTLFRCPFGARALLYVSQPGRWIAFASLPEPLLTIPGVKAHIDEAALAAQLTGGANRGQSADATLFTRLRRVPGAHALRFTQTSVSVTPYWKLDVAPPIDAAPDDPEVPRALLRLMEGAVRRRVSGIDHIGTQLSGGLDSSAVTALAYAHRDADARLFHYTIRKHDTHRQLIDPEELDLAAAVGTTLPDAMSRQVLHHKTNRPYYLSPHYLERPLSDWVFWLGPDHRVLARAREDGCSVMLTGWGGDEMVSSRTRLHLLAMFAERRWRPALNNFLPRGDWLNPLRTLWRDVTVPLGAGVMGRTRWGRESDDRLRALFEGKPLAPLVATGRRTRRALSVRRQRVDALSTAGHSLPLELQDWLGQRAGLACLHPLLDRELVAFSNRIPAEWIAHLGVRRRGFRTALAGILPEGPRAREKARRTPRPAVEAWVQRRRVITQRALDDLATSPSWLHEYVNLQLLAAMTRELRAATGHDPITRLGASVLVVARFAR